MLSRWASFARFVSDGRICMTNNAADRGGDRTAAMYTPIQTCRLNDVDPHAWLRDVIAQISDHPQTRLHELLPWEWKLDSSGPKPSRKPLNRACEKPGLHFATRGQTAGRDRGHRLRRGYQHVSQDGAIQIIDNNFGGGDWAIASAFTDEGLESLRYIIDEIKLHGS
jgi:hypothetical protein